MTIARSVADVLRDHVTLELEGIDRMYLNIYVPFVQTVGGIVTYLRKHRGLPYASTASVAPMTETFVRKIEQFIAQQGIDLVSFEKGQRKDDVTQKYLRQFQATEGVLYVGKAQEKARVPRTQQRRSAKTGKTYPHIVDGTAMVNHYYFYAVDEDFGPFFLKFCSYFPYNAKLTINGHDEPPPIQWTPVVGSKSQEKVFDEKTRKTIVYGRLQTASGRSGGFEWPADRVGGQGAWVA